MVKNKLLDWALTGTVMLTGSGALAKTAEAQIPSRQDTYGQPIRTVYDNDVARLEAEKKACDSQGINAQRTANGAITGILGALGNGQNPFQGALRGAADQTYQDAQREQATATRCSQNAVELNDVLNRQAAARQEAANNRAAEIGIQKQYPQGGVVVVPTAPENSSSATACATVYSDTFRAIINSRNPNVNLATREAQRAETICRDQHR